MPVKTTTMFGRTWERRPRTKNHRPAIWECMLGTVYAMNDRGKVGYFDYDWDKAVEFAGLSNKRDLRCDRIKRGQAQRVGEGTDVLSVGKLVFWCEKA